MIILSMLYRKREELNTTRLLTVINCVVVPVASRFNTSMAFDKYKCLENAL